MLNDKQPVIVVGGGIAGLACAVALCDAGISVRLFEGANGFGGRARSCRDTGTGDVVDIGPHVLTSEHRNMLALMERLGTQDRVLWQPEKFITLVDAGKSLSMRNYALPAPLHFLPNFFRVPRLSTADIHSARRVLLKVMKLTEEDVLRYDNLDAQQALRTMGVSERFIDWFWRTTCMAIMNVPLEHCSAGSLMRFLAMMSGRNDFHFGFPTASLESLYVPAALDVIRRAKGEAHCAAPVRELSVAGNAVKGIVLEDGTRVQGRQCVLAIPPVATSALMPGAWPGFSAIARMQPSPYISTYLWFERSLTRERFWARTWSPGNINYDFYDLSNIRPDIHGGSLIACNCIYSGRYADWSDDALINGTLRELAEYLPGATFDKLRHARVHRIAMAITAPTPGFEGRRPATRTAMNGLFLAGDWIQTALPESMESAVRSGFLAAEAVAAERGLDLERALPRRAPAGLAGWAWRRANGAHAE